MQFDGRFYLLLFCYSIEVQTPCHLVVDRVDESAVAAVTLGFVLWKRPIYLAVIASI